ncbi:MAG: archaeosortase/exosortase family protein [Bacteroidia bacterium]|jgi:exosortase family protein XrtF|nr:archaeosortase/exosortase family protein [Bacteroidia bacterium]
MRPTNQLIRFLAILGLLGGIWFGTYEFYLKPVAVPDKYLTAWVSEGICFFLNHTGYISYYTSAAFDGDAYVFIEPFKRQVVRVGASCNGTELFALFLFFTIAYPGKWKYKIPFLIGGTLAIFILNVIRSYILTLMAYYRYPYYDLFHRYILLFLIYGFVFYLWMLWANKLSKV